MTASTGNKHLGIEFAPLNVPLQRRLQTAAVAFFIFMFFVTPPLSLYLTYYLFVHTRYWWVMVLYGIWFYWDKDRSKSGPRSFMWLKHSPLWGYVRDYFPIRLVKTAELSPDRNYIFGYHPHGMTSVGAFVNFATSSTGFQELFPGVTSHLITLVGQFWYPFRREIVMAVDVHESSREGISALLGRPDKGHAAVIVVGGASEAVDAMPATYNLTLRRRKGFVKLAIKYGADLVPVFSFGENDLYLQVTTNPDSIWRAIQMKLKQYFGIPPIMFHGRGIFNYTFGLLPFRRPITTIVGKPIRVSQCDNPTVEQIDQLHNQYMTELNQLFEDNKKQHGLPEDATLNILY